MAATRQTADQVTTRAGEALSDAVLVMRSQRDRAAFAGYPHRYDHGFRSWLFAIAYHTIADHSERPKQPQGRSDYGPVSAGSTRLPAPGVRRLRALFRHATKPKEISNGT